MRFAIALVFVLFSCELFSQRTDTTLTHTQKKEKNALKFNINDDGSHYFQVTFLNQTWLRYNQSNDSSTLFNKSTANTFDIGFR